MAADRDRGHGLEIYNLQGESVIKRTFGWCLFLLMTPLMAVGAVAYVLCDAVAYGWRMASEWFDAW